MTVKADDEWGQEIELVTGLQDRDTLHGPLRQYYMKTVPLIKAASPFKAESPIILAFPLKNDKLIGGRSEDVYSSYTLIGRFNVPVIAIFSN